MHRGTNLSRFGPISLAFETETVTSGPRWVQVYRKNQELISFCLETFFLMGSLVQKFPDKGSNKGLEFVCRLEKWMHTAYLREHEDCQIEASVQSNPLPAKAKP